MMEDTPTGSASTMPPKRTSPSTCDQVVVLHTSVWQLALGGLQDKIIGDYGARKSPGGSHPHQNGHNNMRFSLFQKFITLCSPWFVLAFPLPPRLALIGRPSVKIVVTRVFITFLDTAEVQDRMDDHLRM